MKLQAAHDHMVQVEQSKRAMTKRGPTYTRNSERTKERKMLQGRKIEAAGYPSIRNCFAKAPVMESEPAWKIVRTQMHE